MINNKSVLAVVPARSGSKGLPGKNIKDLLGKPLINWTIETALESSIIDFIYVSTDSREIADIVEQTGVRVHSLRPPHLASDTASSIDVIEYSITEAEKMTGKKFDIIILLEPTSPLRNSEDLTNAFNRLLENKEASAITGVCRVEDQHPEFLVSLDNSNFHSPFLERDESNGHKRRQDISDLYFHEGSLYIAYRDTLLKNRSFYTDKTLGYVLPKWKSLEIDDIYDFIMVEAILKSKLDGIIE